MERGMRWCCPQQTRAVKRRKERLAGLRELSLDHRAGYEGVMSMPSVKNHWSPGRVIRAQTELQEKQGCAFHTWELFYHITYLSVEAFCILGDFVELWKPQHALLSARPLKDSQSEGRQRGEDLCGDDKALNTALRLYPVPGFRLCEWWLLVKSKPETPWFTIPHTSSKQNKRKKKSPFSFYC